MTSMLGALTITQTELILASFAAEKNLSKLSSKAWISLKIIISKLCRKQIIPFLRTSQKISAMEGMMENIIINQYS